MARGKRPSLSVISTLDAELSSAATIRFDGTWKDWVLADPDLQRFDKPVRVTLRLEDRGTREPRRWVHNENEDHQLWVFRTKVVDVVGASGSRSDEVALRVQHAVLSEEKEFQKLRREIELFEKFGKSTALPREPIPESVRMFVWRREQGRCVTCDSTEKLEFDHIIPISKGGSNTERNIQLLCETCNREKSARI